MREQQKAFFSSRQFGFISPENGFQDTQSQTGTGRFNRTTSQLRGVGGVSDTASARNLGGADTTSSFYEKERRAIEKIKQQQKRDIENMLESELIKQSIELKAQEKVKKMAMKQALLQEEIKQKQRQRELHRIQEEQLKAEREESEARAIQARHEQL